MTELVDAAEADRALKTRHRTMWAFGDYPSVASEVVAGLGPVLVDAVGVTAGERVLDVAAGSGNASLPAAARGARVVASDLTPALLDAGRRAAEGSGVEVEWREADAEALPFADGEFDVALSCIGIMFAPHHQAAADELVRVVRPGGRLGLASWTPEGFVGQMFATMKPYAPPPPPGVQPAPLWGREEHVRALLGDRVEDVLTERRTLSVDRFASPEGFRDFFKARYGPTIAVYRAIGEDPAKVAELDAALDALARGYLRETGEGPVMEWEYLLLTARRS